MLFFKHDEQYLCVRLLDKDAFEKTQRRINKSDISEENKKTSLKKIIER